MIKKLIFAAVLTLAPVHASANQISDSIIAQLRAQGFTSISISRTLLRRARIVAQSPTLDREIIFNPVTGTIIRDYWTERKSGQVGVTIVDPNHDKNGKEGGSEHEGGNKGGESNGGGGNSGSGNGGGGGDTGGDEGEDSDNDHGGDDSDGGDDGEGDDGEDGGDGEDGDGGEDGGDDGEGDDGDHGGEDD